MKEEEIETKLEKNLELIEPGLKLIKRQKRVSNGTIDLFCKDKENNYVIVEIKKKPTPNVITQLAKYKMSFVKKGISIKKLRTILVAQKFSKSIKDICEFFNFEIKELFEERDRQIKLEKTKPKRIGPFELFEDNLHMKVLFYLIEGRHFDYTLTDLANNAGVSWGTLHTIFPKLLKYRIVKKVREIGRAKLYKINQENPIAKQIIQLYDFMADFNLKNLQKLKKTVAV